MIALSNFKKKWPLIGLLFYLFSIPLQGANDINFIETDLETAQNLAAKEDKLFFIYYGADWCMPCKWMEENTFQDLGLANYINRDYIAIKANISTADGRILKIQFDVSNIPSILVFAASGKLIDRKTSSIDADLMLEWLQRLDRPQHHLNQAQKLNITSSGSSLESPQPNIHFQRPSLIPDDSPAGLLTELEREDVLVLHQPAITASINASFMPRSSLRYGVKLDNNTYTYQMAVREVISLEQKYDQPTELAPEPNNLLSIIIGDFETTGKAQIFLNFLNRNDVKGQVVVLKNVKH